ncbi:MAG: MoxR family ATPase [Clostridiales bacterium]|nr:MoxR family ATPase [Clostridiales bacterium]
MNVQEFATEIRENVSRVIVGKDYEIDLIITAILAGGHVLMEDVPGTGKTLMAKTLAKSVNAEFRRVQFTPDLLPTDVTGLSVLDRATGEFVFKPGPVFTNILLADEINRATPRTQSALLECMEEKQVTIDGETRRLPSPFIVIATQNPVETQGTFPLPEAQMDRFLMRLSLGRLTGPENVEMLKRFLGESPLTELSSVCGSEELIQAGRECETVSLSDPVMEYMSALVLNTHAATNVILGVSPRGLIALMRASRAWALIHGRSFVTPDDIKALAQPVLAHRLTLKSVYGMSDAAKTAINEALDMTEVPTEDITEK